MIVQEWVDVRSEIEGEETFLLICGFDCKSWCWNDGSWEQIYGYSVWVCEFIAGVIGPCKNEF